MSNTLYKLDTDYPIKVYQLYIRYGYDDDLEENCTFYFDDLKRCFSRLLNYLQCSVIRIISFSLSELKGFPIEHDDLIQLLEEYKNEI